MLSIKKRIDRLETDLALIKENLLTIQKWINEVELDVDEQEDDEGDDGARCFIDSRWI